MLGDYTETFEETGRIWLRNALGNSDLKPLDAACDFGPKAGARISQNGLAPTLSKLSNLLAAAPVRIVAFNKSEGANWAVPWHQDRIVAVEAKHDVSGFSNWSQKAGVWHAEPPLNVLENILFVRVHLDDTDADAGAMEIARGSHLEGKVAAADAAEMAARYPLEICTAKRGDVLVLKMLTLHRSGVAKIAKSRREVRIDFAASELPKPLKWLT